MRWMVPERRLDEYQLSVLQKCGGLSGQNEWVQGFAGSGKTVLVVHLVQRLLVEQPGAKICVAVFTHALKDLIGTGFEERFRRQVPVMTYDQFLTEGRRYDLVVVDEVQDIAPYKLRRIQELAGRVIVAGDTDQSIYEESSTADDIGAVLRPRPHRLVVIYRLTQKLRDIVRSILPSSQIESAPTGRMENVQVTLAKADSEHAEIEWVWQNCKRHSRPGDPAVVLLPTARFVQSFIEGICRMEGAPQPMFPKQEEGSKRTNYGPANALLKQAGVPLQYLGSDFGSLSDSDEEALTYVMTYHSAKGLDFETVFLPQLIRGRTFWKGNREIDRRLFFVGATRSRKNLFLSYTGSEPHEYVRAMPQQLLHHVKCDPRRERTDETEFYF
jgi:hypothetical protein